MCDSNRTSLNNNKYDDDDYSSQNVGYSGLPQQRDQHVPLSNQNLQQKSDQFDVNSSEPTADRNPPSQSSQYSSNSSDNRTNGSGPGSLDLPAGSKRLHVSNIPFRFRENDLHNVFAVSALVYAIIIHRYIVVCYCRGMVLLVM